jgi:hypothetical protein
MVAIGVGIGLVIPNIAAAALAAVPPADIGKASGILSTSRQVGSVAGVSVGLAIFQATPGPAPPASRRRQRRARPWLRSRPSPGAVAAGVRWTWPCARGGAGVDRRTCIG